MLHFDPHIDHFVTIYLLIPLTYGLLYRYIPPQLYIKWLNFTISQGRESRKTILFWPKWPLLNPTFILFSQVTFDSLKPNPSFYRYIPPLFYTKWLVFHKTALRKTTRAIIFTSHWPFLPPFWHFCHHISLHSLGLYTISPLHSTLIIHRMMKFNYNQAQKHQ